MSQSHLPDSQPESPQPAAQPPSPQPQPHFGQWPGMQIVSHLQQYLYLTVFFVVQYGWQTGTNPSWQPHCGQHVPAAHVGAVVQSAAVSAASDQPASASPPIVSVSEARNVFIFQPFLEMCLAIRYRSIGNYCLSPGGHWPTALASATRGKLRLELELDFRADSAHPAGGCAGRHVGALVVDPVEHHVEVGVQVPIQAERESFHDAADDPVCA